MISPGRGENTKLFETTGFKYPPRKLTHPQKCQKGIKGYVKNSLEKPGNPHWSLVVCFHVSEIPPGSKSSGNHGENRRCLHFTCTKTERYEWILPQTQRRIISVCPGELWNFVNLKSCLMSKPLAKLPAIDIDSYGAHARASDVTFSPCHSLN